MEEIKEKKREFTLPKKTVILKPILERTPGMVKDTNHVASFLVGDSNRKICTPRVKGRKEIDCPLTDEEIKFFEDKDRSGLTFEKGDLNIYSKKWGKKNNKSWWEDSEKSTITIGKVDMTFDLSKPMDYIRYKILLKNSDLVAQSRDELKYKPSCLYIFEETNETARTKASTVQKKMDAYDKLKAFSKDKAKMVDLCTVLGKKVTETQEVSHLTGILGQEIEDNVNKFLEAVEDEFYDEKVLMGKLLKARLVNRRGSTYTLANGEPMCERGEVAYLENACIFLKADENQEIRLSMEAKLKQDK